MFQPLSLIPLRSAIHASKRSAVFAANNMARAILYVRCGGATPHAQLFANPHVRGRSAGMSQLLGRAWLDPIHLINSFLM